MKDINNKPSRLDIISAHVQACRLPHYIEGRVIVDLVKGDVSAIVTLVGRNEAPHCIKYWFESEIISFEQLRSVLLNMWCSAEFPCRALPRRLWLDWFRRAGYLSDESAPRPTKPTEVWRAQAGRVRGLSWTTDKDKAVWFHKRNELLRLKDPLVLRGFVQPSGVLALTGARNEREIVCDPAAVKLVEMAA